MENESGTSTGGISSVPDASSLSQPAAFQPTDLYAQGPKELFSVTEAQEHRRPRPRSHHCAAAIEDKVMVWGGIGSHKRVAPVVEVFDVRSRHWEQWKTTGPQPGLAGAACASIGKYLFVYGGCSTCGDPLERPRQLHQLNTSTMQWTVMPPQASATESPKAESHCSMAAMGNQLALLGTPSQSSLGGERLSNEFCLYDLEEDKWIFPVTTGERPPPCSGFTLTSIDHRRAVVFGGNKLHMFYGVLGGFDNEYMDDVYIIDVQSLHWTKMNKPESGPWPVERSDHAACCLNYGQEYPKLLVAGGTNSNGIGEELEYIWILDVDNESWTEARNIPFCLCGYKDSEIALYNLGCGCSATAVDLGRGVTEVVIFGGAENRHCSHWSHDNLKTDRTAVLSFGVVSLFQLCLNYILTNHRFYEPLLQQFLPHHMQSHIHQEREKNQYGIFDKIL